MKLPDISGRFTTPKPWQIAVGAGAIAVFVLVAPAITHVMMGEKKKRDTAQLTSVGKVGEPWHPAAFPVVPLRPVTPPPSPPPVAIPIPQPAPLMATKPPASALAATKPPGKEPVDPEQEAINAPILISGGQGGAPAAAPVGQASRQQPQGESSAMSALLKPTELTGFRATRMQHPNMTVEQGRVIQCHAVTRMTSGLPGFVRATVANDVWSADGTTKLIDRDSSIFGEIGHGLANGQERLFVLWHQITTPPPNLVRITLNSPAADEMGEAGLAGDIDHHFWPRVKGAILLSGIDMLSSGLSGALSNLGRGNGNTQEQGLNLNFSQAGGQGSNLAAQMLQSTIQIPDTMTVNQAAACSVFVASDLDFSGVYEVARKK